MSRLAFPEEKNLASSNLGGTLSSTANGAIATSGLFLEFYVPVCLKPTPYITARASAERKKVKAAKANITVASAGGGGKGGGGNTSSTINLNETTPTQRYLACLLQNADVPKSRHGVAVLGADLLCYRYNLADREQRNFVLSKLVDICTTLGPKLCRTYVLPSLERLLDIDDATFPIAKYLSKLFELCNGNTTAGVFSVLIHNLCGAADSVVAQEATNNVKTILSEETLRIQGLLTAKSTEEKANAKEIASASNQLEKKCILERIRKQILRDNSSIARNTIPLIQEMADSMWSSHRAAAASLLPAVAALLGTEDTVGSSTVAYVGLCEDPDVTVRKAAVNALHEWLPVVSSSEWIDFPLSLVTYFASEKKQDSVGINLAAELVPLAQGIGKALTSRLLLAPTIALARNVSWRVRFTVATNIGTLMHAFSNSISSLLPSILLLTRDEEVHVRAVAASQLGTLTEVVDQSIIEGPVVDVIYELAKDPSPEVRAAVAKSVSTIAVVCPPTVRVSLLTCVLASLINDARSTLVQHAAINSMTGLKIFKEESGSQEVVTLLVAQLEEASKSTKWRVRQAVASQLNAFSEGTSWDFDELMPIFLRLLNDDVAAVRSSALEGFPVVAERLGTAWVKPKLVTILPQMVYPDRSPKHYRRIQACLLLQALLPSLDSDLLPSYKQRKARQEEQQHLQIGSLSTLSTDEIAGDSLTTVDLEGGGIGCTSPTCSITHIGVAAGPPTGAIVKKRQNSNEQLLDVLDKVFTYLGADAVPSVQDHFKILLSSLHDKHTEVFRAEREELQVQFMDPPMTPHFMADTIGRDTAT